MTTPNIDKEEIDDLRLYPEHLRPIVAILFDFETDLSDGFEWYATVESITKLAEMLYNLKEIQK